MPELPTGYRSSLKHLRAGRRRPDRHLAGNRHPGMRAVPQALDHLLALRHRGTAEGRNAKPAALRALPQPRPWLLETLRVVQADLAAVDRDHVAAASAFLHWLEERGRTLAACTQAELHQWLAGPSAPLVRSANFVRSAVAPPHPRRLTPPPTP